MNYNEVAPYILSRGDDSARKKLYLLPFDVTLIANVKGDRPIFKEGFLETQETYMKRLKIWEEHEEKLIFEGWSCKDLGMFQVLTREYDATKIEITPFSGYSVTTETGKKIEYYTLPDTVDDFITDLRRLGIKLFWKDRIMDMYGGMITCDKEVVEYYKIIKDIFKE